jgi:hypothetical protein
MANTLNIHTTQTARTVAGVRTSAWPVRSIDVPTSSRQLMQADVRSTRMLTIAGGEGAVNTAGLVYVAGSDMTGGVSTFAAADGRTIHVLAPRGAA